MFFPFGFANVSSYSVLTKDFCTFFSFFAKKEWAIKYRPSQFFNYQLDELLLFVLHNLLAKCFYH